MSDELPTIWPADAHTLTKHQILKYYFEAWASILSHAEFVESSELLFVDGFAGPGQYSTGEPGSPIVAITAILDHTQTMPRPVRFVMIEKRADRFEVLCQQIEALRPRIAASSKVIVDPPVLGDCDSQIRKLISERAAAGKPVGPALFFLDQFGYANVPMDLIRAVMQHPKCEVLSYLNCKRMNAYLADETKWPTITAAYGDDSWKSALPMVGSPRQRQLIDSYKHRITTAAKVDYVWSFAMFGKNNELLYWLVFSTNSLKGLEQMKKAMWKADSTGSFRFSDRDAADPQGLLFFEDMKSDQYHADQLSKLLTGRTMTDTQMSEYVLTRTPFYKFRRGVQLLCKQGRATKDKGAAWRVRFH